MTDNEWLELIKASPRQAHTILIDEYSDLVYAIVLSKLKGCAVKEEIDDCVSDVFVEIFRNTDKYAAQGSIKSYLSTIAKRTAINTYKQIMYRHRNQSYIEDELTEIPEPADAPDEMLEKKQLRGRIWDIVKSLGEPDSSILICRYVYRMKAKDIARRLSLSVDAVNKRSQRACRQIRKILTSETER